MSLKQNAQKIADKLTPLSKYLGYQYMISESLKQYLNKEVGQLFIPFLWQHCKHPWGSVNGKATAKAYLGPFETSMIKLRNF